ncbi:MAG: S46 family peptidase [Caulobacteraceae bacterium]
MRLGASRRGPALLLLLLFAAGAAPAFAEEGFFPFDEPPTALVRQSLEVDLAPAWLSHLEGASVRLSSGCSGAIVSPLGLLITDEHCVIECEEDLSTPGGDLVAKGFGLEGAPSPKRCPGLTAEVLDGVVDASGAMAAASVGLSGKALEAARTEALADAEKAACAAGRQFRCEPVSLYGGRKFEIYRYRVFGDVRLVLAPPISLAFFGGETANFAFPRTALDFAFLRLFSAGAPTVTSDFLSWSSAPPIEGEASFVAGSPGASQRTLTAGELASQRDVALPLEERDAADLLSRLQRFAAIDPAHRQSGEWALYAAGNDKKLFAGQLHALRASDLITRRKAGDQALEAALRRDPLLVRRVGEPWGEAASADKAFRAQYPMWLELAEDPGGYSRLFTYARILVGAAEARTRIQADRPPQYADELLPGLEEALAAPVKVDPALEELEIEAWLVHARRALGAVADPLLAAQSPGRLAKSLVAGSRLADPAFRLSLWRGGEAAIAASEDPLIAFVRRNAPLFHAVRALFIEDVVGPEEASGARIAALRRAAGEGRAYPEATLSPRLSYGRVARSPGADGAEASGQAFTRLADLYRGASAGALPAAWRAMPDPATVLDFETTNDVLGGDSGGPVVDAQGRIIGVIFDGNAASLAGEFVYEAKTNRAIAVSAAAITSALSKVWDRGDLVAELSRPQTQISLAGAVPRAMMAAKEKRP